METSLKSGLEVPKWNLQLEGGKSWGQRLLVRRARTVIDAGWFIKGFGAVG